MKKQLSQREQLFIKLAIDQYNTLFLPTAAELGIENPISERDYVVLALTNFDEFEKNVQQCRLFGHKMETQTITGKEITGCIRCGSTMQLAELLLKP